MENQPIEQTTVETPQQAYVPTTGQTVEQGSSAKVWYIVGAVAVIVLLALWYVYSTQTPSVNTETSTATTQTTPAVETQTTQLTGGNTTSDISADLNQTDSSVGLDADSAATTNDLQGL